VPGCNLKASAGHHAFPRNRLGTAFNHTFGSFSAHESPELFEPVIKSIIGDEYETLRKLSLMTIQFREADYKRIRKILDKLLKGE